MTPNTLITARAAALFASDLSVHDQPTRVQVGAAVRRSVRVLGGTRACAGALAAAYGDYPETAAARMRWALTVVTRTYARTVPRSSALDPAGEPPTPLPPGSDPPCPPHAQQTPADSQHPSAAMPAVATVSAVMS